MDDNKSFKRTWINEWKKHHNREGDPVVTQCLLVPGDEKNCHRGETILKETESVKRTATNTHEQKHTHKLT